MQDLPIDIRSEVDMPVEPGDIPRAAPARPEILRRLAAVQIAAIRADLDGRDFLETYGEEFEQANPYTRLREATALATQTRKNELIEAFQTNPGETDFDVQENLGATRELLDEADRDGMDSDLAYVRALSGGRMTYEEEKLAAVRIKAARLMTETWSGLSKLDVAKDAVLSLIPGNLLKGNKNLTDSYLNAEGAMRQFYANFKRLPAKEQYEMLPVVMETFREELGDLRGLEAFGELLAPSGLEDMGSFSKWWALFDLADISLITAGLGATLVKQQRMLSVMNQLVDTVKNMDEAARLNTVANLSDKGAEAVGVDRITAYNMASGFDTSLNDALHKGGLSTETLKNIEAFRRMTATMREELAAEGLIIREGLLSDTERMSVETRFTEQLVDINPGIENIRVVERHPHQTVFEYEEVVPVLGGDDIMLPGTILGGTEKVVRRKTLNLTLDDVGHYQQSSAGILSTWLTSPLVWMKGDLKKEVKTALRADSAQARMWNLLQEMEREAVRSILGPAGIKSVPGAGGRQSLERLDNILRVGDELQEVFTPTKLKAGVNGIKLNDAEIEAYYKLRDLEDSAFLIRNWATRQEKIVRGQKAVYWTDDSPAIGRPIEEAAQATREFNGSPATQVWSMQKKRFISKDELNLDFEYGEGNILVKLDGTYSAPNTTEQVTWALVPREVVKELPAIVLHYRPGYITKINKHANYFVKESLPTRVDGVSIAAGEAGARTVTLRMFASRREANEWAAQLRAKDPSRKIQVLEDRELEQATRATGQPSGMAGGYGLFNGPRAQEDIPFGLEGTPPERVGSFEAISRNLSALSRFVPRNMWRMGMEQRLLNQANRIIPGMHFTSFSQLDTAPKNTQAGRFIHKVKAQMDDWMGFPSTEEQLFSALVQEFYEKAIPATRWVAKKTTPRVEDWTRNSIMYLKHKDPFAAMRAASFNLHLGMFNPVQMWVQAQQASAALALNFTNPENIGKALRFSQGIWMWDLMPNSPSGRVKAAEALGLSVKDAETVFRLWEQTGLRDAIKTTADYAAQSRGRGTLMDLISRGTEAGQVFYKSGDLITRRFSFATAITRWLSKNPTKTVHDITTQDLQDILTDTNNMMWNLHKANRAWWQKGALSPATQFWQIGTKTLETLTGANEAFTRGEIAKLWLGQLVLYGAAGMPLGLGTAGVHTGLRLLGWTQSEIDEMDPRIAKLWNEGWLGGMTMLVFGVDSEIGTRSSLAAAFDGIVDQFLFEEANMATRLFGAFGGSMTRFWDGVVSTTAPLSLGMAEARDLSNVDWLQGISDMARAMSSWNNIQKAVAMHNLNMVLSRKGEVIRHKDFTLAEEIAQAIGFQPREIHDTYSLDTLNKAKEQLRADAVNEIVKIYWDTAIKFSDGTATPEEMEKVAVRMAVIVQIASGGDPYQASLIREAVRTKLSQSDDRYSREWRRFRRNFSDGSLTVLLDWRSQLKASPMIRENPEGN